MQLKPRWHLVFLVNIFDAHPENDITLYTVLYTPQPRGLYTAHMHELFRHLAHRASERLGSPWAFAFALGIIVLWALAGPFLGFSTTWQLLINTATTVLTFLMVFLIQNTQNRDTRAVHLKLDELIRAVKAARNNLIDLEELSDAELDEFEDEFRRIRAHKTTRPRTKVTE